MSEAKPPASGDDLLAKIKPRLKRVRTQVCLRPDLVEKWEALQEQLAAAVAAGSGAGGRLSDKGKPGAEEKRLAKEIQALEAEIEGASIWFEFEALPVAKYQAIVAKHPPRKGNQMDLIAGHDRDAVADELVRASLIDPVFSDEGWAAFMETCAPSEWNELRNAAHDANGGEVAPPKSQMASNILSRRGSASA